jgi:hypothetical protein
MSNSHQDRRNKENFGLLFDPENGSSHSFETSSNARREYSSWLAFLMTWP